MDMLLINFFHKGTYFSGFGIGCMIMVVILQVFMGIGMFQATLMGSSQMDWRESAVTMVDIWGF